MEQCRPFRINNVDSSEDAPPVLRPSEAPADLEGHRSAQPPIDLQSYLLRTEERAGGFDDGMTSAGREDANNISLN
ncbi:hypothetical protein AVEN_215688-1 [Araneus ventricosus]|uniref:Uncharacterized protein n=1 Tax=Araneus ventricosus TaxID=182803 RepID=A0A4Y2S500_ARAVE|nr:hypothetical protein AVEN_215688-1 [Araneus ventricosus]